MDAYTSHYNQYQHNKRFISFGISNTKEKFYDWEITANFYAAIHLIEAILYSEYGINEIKTHDERKEMMDDHPETFSGISSKYFSLKTLARTARYNGIVEVSEKDSAQAQTCLEDIELEMNKYIRHK